MRAISFVRFAVHPILCAISRVARLPALAAQLACRPFRHWPWRELAAGLFTPGPFRSQWCAMDWTMRLRAQGLQGAVGLLDSLAARRGRAPDLPAHLLVGIEGEEAAYFYLLRKGYIVVARRWSAGNHPGDLDLVAWQGQLLCIIEVKTRSARDQTPAEAAIDLHKRNLLRRLARQYVRQLPTETAPEVRFDAISVYLVPGRPPEFLHFESAFRWRETRADRFA